MASTSYDLIVIGTGFAGCMTALNFLETSRRLPNPGRVALVEAGKKDERCGASRWTGAFLRLDRNLDFDEDWISEMIQVSNNQADLAYCRKLAQEAKATAEYVQDHGVRFILHEEKDVDWPIRPIIIIIIIIIIIRLLVILLLTRLALGFAGIQDKPTLCHARRGRVGDHSDAHEAY